MILFLVVWLHDIFEFHGMNGVLVLGETTTVRAKLQEVRICYRIMHYTEDQGRVKCEVGLL